MGTAPANLAIFLLSALACIPLSAPAQGLGTKTPLKEYIRFGNQNVAIENAAARISFSPTSLVFGNQTVGTTSPGKPIKVTNGGAKPMTISSIALSNTSDFSSTNNCPATLAVSANCTITVTFHPKAANARQANLVFTDSAVGSPQSVSISGTGGSPAPLLKLSENAQDFGSQNVGASSPAQTVTLSNTGTAALAISSISVSGASSSSFQASSNCGTSLPLNASCTVNVTFSPASTGNFAATLQIADNASGSPQSVALKGSGVAPSVSLSPSPLPAFASQSVGTSSAGQTVTVTNNGSAPLTISSASITGTNAGDFSVSNGCPTATSLGVNLTCGIGVTFEPTATGPRSAILQISDNAAGSPQSVGLTGTGVAPIVSISPQTRTIDFSNINLGSTAALQAITLSNIGGATLNFAAGTPVTIGGTNSGDFYLDGDHCYGSVAPGATCTVSVGFAPTEAGSLSAVLQFTDDALDSPQSVNLTGMGVVVPKIAASPNNINFNSVTVGEHAWSLVTVESAGTGNLTVSASISGTGFSISTNSCGGSIPPLGKCEILIQFSPQSVGYANGELSLTTNGAGSAQIGLTGIGVRP